MPTRSPNYPGLDLSDAVEAVKKIYRKEGQSAMPPEVAVKAIGYKTLNGASRSALSAIRQYGLMNFKRGTAGKLSERGLTLALRKETSQDYRQALREAALEPELFRNLYDNMRDASHDNVIHYLVVRRGFTHEGAERCSRVFREALAIANLNGSGMISGHDDGFLAEEDENQDGDDIMDSPAQTTTLRRTQEETIITPSPDKAVFIIVGGDTSIRIEMPLPIPKSKWEQIEAMFKAVKSDFVIEEPVQSSSGTIGDERSPDSSP